MAESVLVFVSHSSDDKSEYIEPIVRDLEDCYISVWIDKRKIVQGENLRKSIFREGIDKADVVLIFFTMQSLNSSWVDREIKHVLREESKKGNSFDLRKIISIFDSKETYEQIAERYPELTDDLLHLMPLEYGKIELGKLVSATWSKYLSLQGGDVETQRQLFAKDKEIFQKERELHDLSQKLKDLQSKNPKNSQHEEFEKIFSTGSVDAFVSKQKELLSGKAVQNEDIDNIAAAQAFGLVQPYSDKNSRITDKGKDFIAWLILKNSSA